MQLASTSTPRSAANSATCSYDSGYRRYQRTHKMITSPGCCRPLNGLLGVIGMDFYPTSLSTRKFATEPLVMSATPTRTIGILSPARLAFSKRDGLARLHYLSICTGVVGSGAGVCLRP